MNERIKGEIEYAVNNTPFIKNGVDDFYDRKTVLNLIANFVDRFKPDNKCECCNRTGYFNK